MTSRGGAIPRERPRLMALGAVPVVDVGCGRGRLLAAFAESGWLGRDGSPSQLANCAGARRLWPGEWFVSCTTSLRDAPQLLTEHARTTFDAEDAVHLETTDDVEQYRIAHLLRPDQLHPLTPLHLTEVGVGVWAQKAD